MYNFPPSERDLYCIAMQWLRFILPENSTQKNGIYFPKSTLTQQIQKSFACLISLQTRSVMI